MVVVSPPLAGPAYVDFVVLSALGHESLAKGSALKDGVAAALAGSKKCRKYPGCAVYPFPVEDHGRIGDAAAAFVRLIAPRAPAERSTSIAELCVPRLRLRLAARVGMRLSSQRASGHEPQARSSVRRRCSPAAGVSEAAVLSGRGGPLRSAAGART